MTSGSSEPDVRGGRSRRRTGVDVTVPQQPLAVGAGEERRPAHAVSTGGIRPVGGRPSRPDDRSEGVCHRGIAGVRVHGPRERLTRALAGRRLEYARRSPRGWTHLARRFGRCVDGPRLTPHSDRRRHDGVDRSRRQVAVTTPRPSSMAGDWRPSAPRATSAAADERRTRSLPDSRPACTRGRALVAVDRRGTAAATALRWSCRLIHARQVSSAASPSLRRTTQRVTAGAHELSRSAPTQTRSTGTTSWTRRAATGSTRCGPRCSAPTTASSPRPAS